MIKKSLRLMLLGAFALMSSVFVACDKYDDDIQGLQQQIDAMGSQFESLKAQVAGLQGEIDGGAVITDVKATAEGIVVTLSNGKSYTVKNGEKGEKGDQGEQGIQGEKGDKGDQGEKGDKGDKGDQGEQGIQGEKGDKGDQGEKGDKGDKGDQGEAGKDGQDGKDGVDGKDGKDGSVVTIGANGNWFIDGVDTGKPSQGAAGKDGQDGKDGVDGKDGQDGKDGENGKDGINGTNGKDGVDGKDGKDADVIYYEPCTEEGENFGKWIKYVNGEIAEVGESWLHDGVLTAVYDPYKGELSFHGVEGQNGEDLIVKTGAQLASLAIETIDYSNVTFMPLVEANNLVVNKGTVAVPKDVIIASLPIEIKYRVNPSNAVLRGVNYSFINKNIKLKSASADQVLFTVEDNDEVATNGIIKVIAKLNMTAEQLEAINTAGLHNVFALKATLPDGGEVVSDYAEFRKNDYSDFEMLNITDEDEDNYYPETQETKPQTVNLNKSAELVYTEELDMKEVVALALDLGQNEYELLSEKGFQVDYEYDINFTHIDQADNTDQNSFVQLNGSKLSLADSYKNSRAAIGRKPLIKVTAKVNGEILDVAYIVVEIVEERTVPVAGINPIWSKGFEYSDIIAYNQTTASELPLTWDVMNKEVYKVLDMSETEFKAIYSKYNVCYWDEVANVPVKYYISANSYETASDNLTDEPVGSTGAYITAQFSNATTQSNVLSLQFDPAQVKSEVKDTVFVEFIPIDTKNYGVVTLGFEYTINHTEKFPKLNAHYKQPTNTSVQFPELVDGEIEYQPAQSLETVITRGTVDGGFLFQSDIEEFIENYSVGFALPGNHTAIEFKLNGYVYNGKLYNAISPELPVIKTGTTKWNVANDGYGVTLTNSAATTPNGTIKLDTPLKLSEASRLYVVDMILTMENGEQCTKSFVVKFENPFEVKFLVNKVELKTLPAGDEARIDTLFAIYDHADKLIYSLNKVVNSEYKADPTTNGLTAYAEDIYGFNTSDIAPITFSMNTTGFKPTDLAINPTTGVITWKNSGSSFVADVTKEATVNVTINGVAELQAKVNVTLLSDENSKK